MLDLGEELFELLVEIGQVVFQHVSIWVLIGLLALAFVVLVAVASLLTGAQP